jgi:hypothetical protein
MVVVCNTGRLPVGKNQSEGIVGYLMRGDEIEAFGDATALQHIHAQKAARSGRCHERIVVTIVVLAPIQDSYQQSMIIDPQPSAAHPQIAPGNDAWLAADLGRRRRRSIEMLVSIGCHQQRHIVKNIKIKRQSAHA